MLGLFFPTQVLVPVKYFLFWKNDFMLKLRHIRTGGVRFNEWLRS
jgi:hypothetical protein